MRRPSVYPLSYAIEIVAVGDPVTLASVVVTADPDMVTTTTTPAEEEAETTSETEVSPAYMHFVRDVRNAKGVLIEDTDENCRFSRKVPNETVQMAF